MVRSPLSARSIDLSSNDQSWRSADAFVALKNFDGVASYSACRLWGGGHPRRMAREERDDACADLGIDTSERPSSCGRQCSSGATAGGAVTLGAGWRAPAASSAPTVTMARHVDRFRSPNHVMPSCTRSSSSRYEPGTSGAVMSNDVENSSPARTRYGSCAASSSGSLSSALLDAPRAERARFAGAKGHAALATHGAACLEWRFADDDTGAEPDLEPSVDEERTDLQADRRAGGV